MCWYAKILRVPPIMFFFFFSSRRRHTRLQGDWSSDVCSSDLLLGQRAVDLDEPRLPQHQPALLETAEDLAGEPARHRVRLDQDQSPLDRQTAQIGRASCRERV